MSNICIKCGSQAINLHLNGRTPNDDPNLCDVCYWRKQHQIQFNTAVALDKSLTQFIDENRLLHKENEKLMDSKPITPYVYLLGQILNGLLISSTATDDPALVEEIALNMADNLRPFMDR